jgi:cysteine desulfurase/selenocysteine lyase
MLCTRNARPKRIFETLEAEPSPMSDQSPVRLGDRSLFSTLRARAYLNHAAISPASDPVRAAVSRAISELSEQGSSAFSARLAEREQLRVSLGRLLGADSDEIALVPNTMYGLSALATALPFESGDRLIVFEGEYPTNVSVWQQLSERFGLSLVRLPVADFAIASGADFGRVKAELARGRVRLCAISAVQFQTGLRVPLAELAELCHAHGAELAVDAVQGLGCVPLDVRALGIDYLAAGSHKWLMGTDGAGVLYARRDLAARMRPMLVGAMSHVDAVRLFTGRDELRYDRPLRADIGVFEGGMMSSLSVAALAASLELLSRLGPTAIFEHVQRYHDLLEAGLLARGFRSLRAADLARRSGILGVLPPPTAADSANLAARLGQRGIVCSSPQGVLRFAPHFPNALSEVPEVLAALDDALR